MLVRGGSRDAADGVRHPLAQIRRTVDRIECDVVARCPHPPHAESLAFEDPRRLVFDSFAADHFAADVGDVEHAADGISGGRIGRHFVPLAYPLRAIQGRDFRRA